ncbi:MAG: tetratricopeptide repeat protein [Planctomycetota bacterium]|jgi:tetratricopeptide (TPR) repeat protein
MRSVLYLLCGLVGGVAGGLLVHALDGDGAPRRASVEARRPEIRDEAPGDRGELLRRLEAVESAVAKPAVPVATPAGQVQPAPVAETPEEAPERPLPADVQAAVETLVGKRIGPAEANAIFAWLGAHQEKIPAAIQALEEEVAAHPKDPNLRVALATAYVSQLMYVTPTGAQQGLVWMRAAGSYDEAIKLEPEHWQARFGKAVGTTFIPPQFGQQPHAIRQFEELMDLQERAAPEAHHVHTYFQLGNLYKEMGNQEKARKIWARGLKLFPENGVLRDALDVSTER